jgi:two-component system, cell cycle response regulator
MSVIVNISLLGFVPFEKTTFESFFKLAGRRDTAYKIVESTADASIFLVNGNNATAAQWIGASIKPSQKAVFVGEPDSNGQWPAAPRPIRLTTVLGLLDAISMAGDLKSTDKEKSVTARHMPVQSQPQSATVTPAPSIAILPKPVLLPMQKPVPGGKKSPATSVTSGYGARRSSSSDFNVSNFMGLARPADHDSVSQQYDEILIVDDSDVALKFMQNRLTRYGFRARLARSGEEALTRVAAEKYKFVFMDVMMDGLDGYQTCRAIKQKKYPSGKAPVVVMLTSRGGSIDKIKGGLAGCDAYLTKPLNEAELLKILSKFDEQVERSFQKTNIGGSGMSSKYSV